MRDAQALHGCLGCTGFTRVRGVRGNLSVGRAAHQPLQDHTHLPQTEQSGAATTIARTFPKRSSQEQQPPSTAPAPNGAVRCSNHHCPHLPRAPRTTPQDIRTARLPPQFRPHPRARCVKAAVCVTAARARCVALTKGPCPVSITTAESAPRSPHAFATYLPASPQPSLALPACVRRGARARKNLLLATCGRGAPTAEKGPEAVSRSARRRCTAACLAGGAAQVRFNGGGGAGKRVGGGGVALPSRHKPNYPQSWNELVVVRGVGMIGSRACAAGRG